ncbi:hypothetical protein [Paraliobacillus quinghaiensis]|nr:hypothetical protein [Paraliobacillus quinghaiensis]
MHYQIFKLSSVSNKIGDTPAGTARAEDPLGKRPLGLRLLGPPKRFAYPS